MFDSWRGSGPMPAAPASSLTGAVGVPGGQSTLGGLRGRPVVQVRGRTHSARSRWLISGCRSWAVRNGRRIKVPKGCDWRTLRRPAPGHEAPTFRCNPKCRGRGWPEPEIGRRLCRRTGPHGL